MSPSSHDFKTKQDCVVSGRSIQTHTESAVDLSFDKSLYADDKAKLHDTREELKAGMQTVYTVFKKFGLTFVTWGANNAESKTEAMPPPPTPVARYEDADNSPIPINTEEDTGEIPFTSTFKLLGSMLAKRTM
jgi:hypothetical protein